MKDQEILNLYCNLIPFLATVLGNGCEVVVHDLSNPKHSIIAIENSLSGRKKGDAMTDFPYEKLGTKDYVSNYYGRSKDKEFLSSTFCIKNKGKVIGLLCINKDITCVQQLNYSVLTFLKRYGLEIPQTSGDLNENLSSVDSIMKSKITEAIHETGQDASHLTVDEKVQIVWKLKNSGVLSMKGAVNEAAEQLEVSVPTIYRYLKKNA